MTLVERKVRFWMELTFQVLSDAYRAPNKGLTLEDKADNLSLEQQKSIGKQMDGKEK